MRIQLFSPANDPAITTKSDYGDTGRLEPDDARRFIKDCCHYIQSQAYNEIWPPAEDESSSAKQKYGDTWTLIYGIVEGMRLMQDAEVKRIDRDGGAATVENLGITGDDSWKEHYDEYGYGTYGDGLKIGKRLAFYEDRDFTFSTDSQSEKTEATFTITSYD